MSCFFFKRKFYYCFRPKMAGVYKNKIAIFCQVTCLLFNYFYVNKYLQIILFGKIIGAS